MVVAVGDTKGSSASLVQLVPDFILDDDFAGSVRRFFEIEKVKFMEEAHDMGEGQGVEFEEWRPVFVMVVFLVLVWKMEIVFNSGFTVVVVVEQSIRITVGP